MRRELLENFPRYWEHCSVFSNDTSEKIIRLCDEAREYGFVAVCALNYFVPLLAERLAGSGVRVEGVAGYPLGYTETGAKAKEALSLVRQGADEVDMCMAFNAFFDGKHDFVRNDIRAVVEAVKGYKSDAYVKVIIETSFLEPAQIQTACELVAQSGADFVKASSGYARYGSRLEDIKLMKATVGDAVKVKASGGIRSLEFALQLIEAGAERLGGTAGIELAEAAKGYLALK